MPVSPEVIDLVCDILRAAPGLAGLKEFNKANGLVSLAASGCSVGLERETFEPYTKDQDEATATLRILIWTKHRNPAEGEALARAWAQEARLALTENRTLGGAAADSYVYGILYTTAEGDAQNPLLHLAELDYRVRYYSPRARAEEAVPIEQVNNDVGIG